MGSSNDWFTPSNTDDQTMVVPSRAKRNAVPQVKARRRTPKRIDGMTLIGVVFCAAPVLYFIWRLIG